MLHLSTVGISLPFGEIKACIYKYIYTQTHIYKFFFFRNLNFMAQNFNSQPSTFTLVKLDNTKANSTNECKYLYLHFNVKTS